MISSSWIPGMAHRLRPWNPAQDIPNVVAGWNARLINVAEDTNLSSVTAEVGSTALTQITADKGALFKPTGINGKPGMYFATDRGMKADAIATLVAGTDVPFTVYGVLQMDDAGIDQTAFSFAANLSRPYHNLRKLANNSCTINRTDDAATLVSATGPASFAVTPIAFIQVFTGTTVTIYSGTSLTADPSAASLDNGASTFTQFSLGVRRRSSNDLFMTGLWGCCYIATGAQTNTNVLSRFMNAMTQQFGTP